MIRRLLARRPRPRLSADTASLPAGVRLYAVGDIHGRADLLEQIQRLIVDDAATAHGLALQVVYLGDYVDRGLQGREVIEMLATAPLQGFTTICLRGNHDQQFLDFLKLRQGGNEWLQYGGDATVYSYGVRIAEGVDHGGRLDRMWQDLARAVPQRHVTFLEHLRFAYEIGDYIFVHAGVDPEKDLAMQTEADLLWIRDEFLDSDVDYGKIIVHGHSMSRDPDVRSNRIGIDTGACYSNRLTALVLEGRSRRFLATQPI
ncbi:MAG: metallophosphoesterase family protein [Rhodospirillales bacterium]